MLESAEPQKIVKAVSHRQSASIFVCLIKRIKMLISLIKNVGLCMNSIDVTLGSA